MEKIMDFKYLLYRILNKWYICLIAGIVLAVAFDVYSVISSKNDTILEEKITLEEQIKNKEADIEDTKKVINLSKQKEGEVAYETYLRLHGVFDSLQEYYDNSLYMKIDPNSVPITTLQFVVDNHYLVTYPDIDKHDTTNDIIAMFTSAVTNDEFFSDYSDLFDGKYASTYIMELVGCYQKKDNTFNIDIYGIDKDMCDIIADDISAKIYKYYDKVKEVYGDFDLTLQSRMFSNYVKSNVLNDQKNCINSLNEAKGAWNDLSSSLSGGARTYYVQLVELYELNNEEERLVEETEETDENKLSVIQPKKIILGFAGGCLLAFVIIFLCVFKTSVIYTKEALNACYEPEVIANINVEKKKNVINKWLANRFYGEIIKESEAESTELLVDYINILVKSKSIDTLLITCDESETERVQGIADKLAINKVLIGNSSVKKIKSLSEADAVLMIERMGYSRFDRVYDDVMKASMAGIDILGFVSVSNI